MTTPLPFAAAREFDMTITRAEFERLLPLATGGAVRRDGSRYRAADARNDWEIELTPLPDLRIGLIVLARHRVSITPGTLTGQSYQVWLRQFWMVFQRGGG